MFKVNLNNFRKKYYRFIGKILFLLDILFFYPRLTRDFKLLGNKLPINNKKIKIYIVDCGSNYGQSAIFFQKIFPNHKIYCFEPNMDILKSLKKNISSFNAVVFPIALGDKVSEKFLNVSLLPETSTFVKPNLESKYLNFKAKVLLSNKKHLFKKKKVKMMTLDSFYPNPISKIDLLKIDVEGSETELLIGAKKIINKLKPNVILIEIHFDDQYFDHEKKIANILKSYNYVFYKRLKHVFGNFYDYIFIPNHKIEI